MSVFPAVRVGDQAGIEGHPAKKLSFWIERADFVREYQKIGKFWLPQRDQTVVQVRFYGRHVLIINHKDYVVNASLRKQSNAEPNQSRSA